MGIRIWLVVIAEELGRACAPAFEFNYAITTAEAIMAHKRAQKQAWLPVADGSASFALRWVRRWSDDQNNSPQRSATV